MIWRKNGRDAQKNAAGTGIMVEVELVLLRAGRRLRKQRMQI